MEGRTTYEDINEAIDGKDVVCTDPLPASAFEAFRKCQARRQ